MAELAINFALISVPTAVGLILGIGVREALGYRGGDPRG